MSVRINLVVHSIWGKDYAIRAWNRLHEAASEIVTSSIIMFALAVISCLAMIAII